MVITAFFKFRVTESMTADGQIDAVITVVSLLGGSLGIVISIFIFDRKSEKGNMMSRVFVACVLVY